MIREQGNVLGIREVKCTSPATQHLVIQFSPSSQFLRSLIQYEFIEHLLCVIPCGKDGDGGNEDVWSEKNLYSGDPDILLRER